MKIGDMYKGIINNRLFRIKDIEQTKRGETYLIIENVEPQRGELEKMLVEINHFKRLQLVKIN